MAIRKAKTARASLRDATAISPIVLALHDHFRAPLDGVDDYSVSKLHLT